MIDRHILSWTLAALVFWLFNVMLHLEFSNWIIVSYPTPFGDFVPRDHTQPIAFTVCLLVAALVFRLWFRGSNRNITLASWLLLFAAMTACMFLITTTAVEMIHFLQYGILAFMLAYAFDRDRVYWPLLTLMFMTTGLGILDELNQYFYLTINNSSYIDFNDFVLNQIGACAGLLVHYGFTPAPQKHSRWNILQTITVAGYALLGLIALLLGISGHLKYTPVNTVPPGGIDLVDRSVVIFFQREPGLLSSYLPTFTSGHYYVMGIIEGFLVIMLIAGLLHLYKVSCR